MLTRLTGATAGLKKWSRRRWIWITALLLAAVAGGIAVYNHTPGQTEGGAKSRDGSGRPTPIVAATATKGNIDVFLTALGTVTPRNMVTVKARVDGQLLRVAFREGQNVRAGDLLAEIDPRPFQVQLTQASGQLMRDQALLANAQVDLARYKTLLAQDSISGQQVATQESLVRQYQGAVAVDQGVVDNAKLQLSYTRITAPLSGRVGLRQVDPGNMIHASDANGMVTITQEQPITVIFSIPEDNLPQVLGRLRADQTLAVDAFDRDQKAHLTSGTLLTVDNQIDSTTGTVKLKAQFANEDNALFPNQFVNVRMGVDTRRDVTLIPTAAIQRGKQNMAFVYVVKDDKTVTVRQVKPGPTQGEITAVEDGLAPGDIVVADGADKLREGARVEPQERNPAGAGPAEGNRKPREGGRRRRSAE